MPVSSNNHSSSFKCYYIHSDQQGLGKHFHKYFSQPKKASLSSRYLLIENRAVPKSTLSILRRLTSTNNFPTSYYAKSSVLKVERFFNPHQVVQKSSSNII